MELAKLRAGVQREKYLVAWLKTNERISSDEFLDLKSSSMPSSYSDFHDQQHIKKN